MAATAFRFAGSLSQRTNILSQSPSNSVTLLCSRRPVHSADRPRLTEVGIRRQAAELPPPDRHSGADSMSPKAEKKKAGQQELKPPPGMVGPLLRRRFH